jgi:pimeloyl-ACP methyl ester carboxylesterase
MAPYNTAVLHGGPGAPGYMAPVARELGKSIGVLEPLQTKESLKGQIDELADQMMVNADLPVTLIGSSWGAVLALLVAAREESIAKKLILVGSAVFDADSSSRIENIRLQRLRPKKRRRYMELKREMEKTDGESSDSFVEWGGIIFDADIYNPLTRDLEVLEVRQEQFAKVWSDYVALRDRSGFLKSEFSRIKIPVVVIHGEYDPHPIEGIRPFLESCLDNVRFYTLPECGHYPWIERHAREQFFEILKKEI